MRSLVATILFLLLAALAVEPAAKARADGIEVRSQATTNRFPNGIQFTLYVASNADIREVRLRYRILPDGPLTTARGQCNAGATVNCTAQAGGVGQSSAHIAPGAEVIYYWEVSDAAGQSLTTPEQSATYRDDRYQWDAVRDGSVTVNFYLGDAQFVQSVLLTTRQTMERLTALEATRVDFPIKVWIYQTAAEMAPAAASDADPRGQRVTLGELVASDTVLVSRDTELLKILRHELAHIVTRQATKGGIGDVPAWINEGISVYAQNGLIEGQAAVLEQAIRRNQALPITSLTSSLNATNFQLAYAQSGSIIGFLVDSQGPEKFAQFIAGLKSDTPDGSMKKVYGFDQLGLEDAWRKSVGLPPLTGGSSPGGTSPNERPLPTIIPFGSQDSTSGFSATPSGGSAPSTTASTDDDGGGSSALLIVIAAVVVIAVLGGGGGLVYFRRRVRPPA